MKKLAFTLSILLCSFAASAASNPMNDYPGYGVYSELSGYVLTCPDARGTYHYWFAMRGPGTAVSISRLGYPNGNQLFARVVDGQQISGGFELLLINEQGREAYVKFSGNKGIIDFGSFRVNCSVTKTKFVV